MFSEIEERPSRRGEWEADDINDENWYFDRTVDGLLWNPDTSAKLGHAVGTEGEVTIIWHTAADLFICQQKYYSNCEEYVTSKCVTPDEAAILLVGHGLTIPDFLRERLRQGR